MMESDLLNEQINTLTSEYADTFRNINASSLTSVDVSSLESEVEVLKSELVNAEEDLKWATNLIENAQKDMEEKNMGAIPNDPFFENNNKAKEECKRKVNELKRKIEKKENEIADKKKANSNESEIEKLNSIGDKIRKMVEFQKRNLLDSLNAIEKVKSEMIEKAESGIDPTDREIAKMFVKDNNKKIRELKSRIEVFDSILESLTNVETILQNKNELSSDKIKEYYEFFSNYNKEPIGNEDIEINVTFNKDTGKYTVSCKSGNFELKPGKEFTKDELTEENVNKLLKGFAGAISNNKVLVNANGKRYAGARINNAAESIITAANSLEVTKNLGGNQPPKPNNDQPPKPNNDQPPKPNNDQPPKPPQNPKDESNKPDIDPVVHRVISSRNRNRKIGWVSDGIAAGIGICTAIAAGPLLGIPLGVAGVAATEAFVNGSLAFKTAKIRRTLKKIAKANGLKVVTDHETASVYFCGEKGLDSRLTSADLNGPKEVSEVAKKIQEELDKVFNNDLRGTATKEQKDIFLKHKKSSVIPLSMCEKVTLDNIEAAYQNVGGVYKRENGFKLKDGLKIANDFVKSVKPSQNTELEDVTIEDAMGEEFPIIEDAPVVDEEKTEQNTEPKEETAEVKVEEPTPVVPEVETIEPEEIIPEIEIPTIDEVKTEEPVETTPEVKNEEPMEATPEVKAAETVVEETPVVDEEKTEQNTEPKEETAEVKVEEPTPVVPEVETIEPEEIIPEIEIPTIDEVKTEEPVETTPEVKNEETMETTPEVKAAEPVVEETPVVETTPMEQSEQNVEEDKEKGDYIVNADDLLRELGENITVADELVNEESKGMRM